jgi:hypothetical protein
MQTSRAALKPTQTARRAKDFSGRRSKACRPWTEFALAWALVACGDRTGLIVDVPAEPIAPASTSSIVQTMSSTQRASSSSSSTAFTAQTSTIAAITIVDFASGPDWASYVGQALGPNQLLPVPGDGLGPARDVCVTPQTPYGCPPDAVIYGAAQTPWAGSASIPNAPWIWRGDTAMWIGQPVDLQAVLFERQYTVGPQPGGWIQIAVDDFAEVFVNRVSVGTTGSVTSYAAASTGENRAVTIDLTPALREGANVIGVAAQNGPSSFGSNCPATGCTYAQNPAGVAFQGELHW